MELARRQEHFDRVTPMPKPPSPREQAMRMAMAASQAMDDSHNQTVNAFRSYRDAQVMLGRLGETWEKQLPPQQNAGYQVWLREQAGENVRDEVALPEFMDEPL